MPDEQSKSAGSRVGFRSRRICGRRLADDRLQLTGYCATGRSCRGLGDSLDAKRTDDFAGWVNDWMRTCAARVTPFPHSDGAQS